MTPASAITYMSSVLTSTTLSRRRMSSSTVFGLVGTKVRVYDMPPPRATTGQPASLATRTTSATSSGEPGATTMTAVSTSV